MSQLVNFLFGTPQTTIGSFKMDVTLKETHESGALVTSSPVERSASVTDHKVATPKELTITGITSNTPVVFFSLGTIDPTKKHDVVAWEQLNKLVESQDLVTVQTSLKTYSNMTVEKVTADRDKDTNGALEFTAKLKEVIIVENLSEPARAPKQKLPSTPRGSVAPDAKAVQSQSLLSKTIDFLKGLAH